ncbi:hypothetical protein [Mycobacterium sp. NPDC050853]|uniref:hypothetical protein n=1 Tax=Mycobacterium sp. NPDC050853 TaxID=3155160 RepID=UPI0033F5AD94
MLWAAPAAAGPKSPQTPSELGAELQSQGYKVQYERIGNCALDSGSVVGTRGGVTWSHDIDHQIAYITVPCKRTAK